MQRFEEGADVFFASAASISLGRYALPVYEIYKAGRTPSGRTAWTCWARLASTSPSCRTSTTTPAARTTTRASATWAPSASTRCRSSCRPTSPSSVSTPTPPSASTPARSEATVSGQGGITLIGDGAEQRFKAGDRAAVRCLPRLAPRDVVHARTTPATPCRLRFSDDDGRRRRRRPHEPDDAHRRPDVADGQREGRPAGAAQALRERVAPAPAANEGPLVDLVLELREALRDAKRFDLADKARDTLEELGFEIGRHAAGRDVDTTLAPLVRRVPVRRHRALGPRMAGRRDGVPAGARPGLQRAHLGPRRGRAQRGGPPRRRGRPARPRPQRQAGDGLRLRRGHAPTSRR